VFLCLTRIGKPVYYLPAGIPFPCPSVPSVDKPLRRWLGRRNHLHSRPIPWNRRTRRSRGSQNPAMTFAVFNPCSNDDDSRRPKHCRLPLFAIFATFCSRDPSSSISGSSHERASRQPLGRSLPSRLFVRGFIDLRRRAGVGFVPVHRDVTLVPPARRAHFMSSTTSGDSLGGRHDALGLGREHGRKKRTRGLDRVVPLGPTVRHREPLKARRKPKTKSDPAKPPSLTPRSRPKGVDRVMRLGSNTRHREVVNVHRKPKTKSSMTPRSRPERSPARRLSKRRRYKFP
jgi:hypothetical protein